MDKSRDKYKIGQMVEILVYNDHFGEIVPIVAFSEHNPFVVKVRYEDKTIHGYNTSEIRAIPYVGYQRHFSEDDWKHLMKRLLTARI